MRKLFTFICALIVCGQISLAQAALTEIGVVEYDTGTGGGAVRLIWEDDNNGNSLIWFDYRNSASTWQESVDWAAQIDSNIVIWSISSNYQITWEDEAWRLPAAVDGPREVGYDGTTTAGYNITTSELGHLFYDELGNIGRYDTLGNPNPFSEVGLRNQLPFESLRPTNYWSGTVNETNPASWYFDMERGYQDREAWSNQYNGIAVRAGQVSIVPIPGAVWFLGSGLLSLGVAGRRKFYKQKKH